jgi:exodeoxyribonuclease V gamma subunit
MLPPAALGEHDLAPIDETAARILDNYRTATAGRAPSTIEAEMAFPDGRSLRARVPDVFGDAIVRATYATVKSSQSLGVWPELLALAAAFPQQGWRARIEAKDGHVELTAPSGPAAREILQGLFALSVAALRQPCPVTPDTGLAYAAAVGPQAEAAAAAAWAKDRQRNGSAMLHLVGPDAPFRALLADPPLPEEALAGEPTRFGCLARRLYGPLLESDPDAGIRPWPKGAGR